MPHRLIIFSALFAAGVLCSATETGIIKGNKINIRLRPGTGDTIAQLSNGDEVAIFKEEGGWLQIAAPAAAKAYVSAKFIKDGKTTGNVHFRSGPSTQHQSYGIVEAGTPVEVIGTPKGDWLQVKPLPTLKCYVSAQFVKRTPQAVQPPKPQSVPAPVQPVTPPEKLPQTQPQPQPLPQQPVNNPAADLELLKSRFVEGSEKNITAEGRLFRLKNQNGLLRYALVANGDNPKAELICYLYGAATAHAEKLVGKQVRVSGTRHIVHHWPKPVLEVTELKAR